jgi:hypothetical protein
VVLWCETPFDPFTVRPNIVTWYPDVSTDTERPTARGPLVPGRPTSAFRQEPSTFHPRVRRKGDRSLAHPAISPLAPSPERSCGEAGQDGASGPSRLADVTPLEDAEVLDADAARMA